MELSKTVGIYLDTGKQVGDVDHLKVFANEEVTERWFVAHDREGVAFRVSDFRVSGEALTGGFRTSTLTFS